MRASVISVVPFPVTRTVRTAVLLQPHYETHTHTHQRLCSVARGGKSYFTSYGNTNESCVSILITTLASLRLLYMELVLGRAGRASLHKWEWGHFRHLCRYNVVMSHSTESRRQLAMACFYVLDAKQWAKCKCKQAGERGLYCKCCGRHDRILSLQFEWADTQHFASLSSLCQVWH